jgi:hypothetical protein
MERQCGAEKGLGLIMSKDHARAVGSFTPTPLIASVDTNQNLPVSNNPLTYGVNQGDSIPGNLRRWLDGQQDCHNPGFAAVKRRTLLAASAAFLAGKLKRDSAFLLVARSSATGRGVPPPPALQGTAHRIPASGSDQTTTIQNTINAAASGDTIYFDSGTHHVGGQITLKSGQLYIGDTMQFSRVPRTVMKCNNAGFFLIQNASNIAMYGLQWMRSTNGIFGNWSKSSTRNITITNCIFDNQDFAGGPDMMVWGGVRSLTIQWSSLLNGAGTSNNGQGAACSNLLVTRCRFDHCREAIGWAVGNSNDPVGSNTNLYVTFCVFTTNKRIAVEMAPYNGRDNADDIKVNDCWIAGWDASGTGVCISIVAGANLEIARCYINPTDAGASGGLYSGLEFDMPSTKAANIHDNNFQNCGGTAIADNYRAGAMNLITNNNFWQCGSDTDVNPQSTIRGSTHNNVGVPPQPASGAGP